MNYEPPCIKFGTGRVFSMFDKNFKVQKDNKVRVNIENSHTIY